MPHNPRLVIAALANLGHTDGYSVLSDGTVLGGEYDPQALEAEYSRTERVAKISALKAERQRRIFEIAPQDRQNAAFMEAITLQQVIAEGGTLTPEQAARKTYLEAQRDAISAIVVRCQELEVMDPLPDDPTADEWWVV